ncbi:MAG: dienelactone hydrolase [Candidatus Paceibacteria bacterium]|jgi:dienelactone hydrolase
MHPILITLPLSAFLVGLGHFLDEQKADSSPTRQPIAKEVMDLFEYDKEADLELEEGSFVQHNGYSQSDLSFSSPAGGRVPAFLFQPEGEGPHAGILLMHGMPGSRKDALMFASDYVKAGAVVVAISAPWARPDGPRAQILNFTKQDRDEQVQLIQDMMRAVDFLVSMPTVDSERLGYAGVSYGGAMGGLLAGVETRIKAYALVVGDGGLVAHLTGPDDSEHGSGGIPEEQLEDWLGWMKPIEPMLFVAHAAPAHLLFQNGKVDQLVPAADAKLYQEAGSQPKTVLWYEGGHSLSPALMRDQMQWFSERIGTTAPDRAGS